MTSTRNFIATTAFAALSLAHGALPVRATESNSFSVTPIKGISLVLGSKRAIGYYTAENGACNLTLMLQEIPVTDEDLKSSAVRVNMTIGAGTSSSLDTAEGPSVAFKCQPGAASLTFETIHRFAYDAPRD